MSLTVICKVNILCTLKAGALELRTLFNMKYATMKPPFLSFFNTFSEFECYYVDVGKKYSK